ncbi:MAG: ectoine/hydroxyectoine ABC transporter ATP-binding protein EhuA [Streptosporangiales bacterium]|nr:ectoine/hydroxyectoine ABC transporter ATP-binding protein EhuA [Streptosporangiales bacterium]
MVAVNGVTKAYKGHTVLRDLDLEVGAGEKVAIIGPSGSGKTTILRVIMTLERPDGGTIVVDGEQLWHEERDGQLVPAREQHLRRVRSKIGMVFQQFNLFPHMTASDNVTEALRSVARMPREAAEERGRELLEMVGLADRAGHYPWQLSGGQQQRVGIARAIALRPKVLLFDEVTSALDPELVGEVLGVIRDLATHTETTMLIVTHEMRFARDVADRVLMFDQGQIVEEGPPEQLFTEPRSDRTKKFLHAVFEAG